MNTSDDDIAKLARGLIEDSRTFHINANVLTLARWCLEHLGAQTKLTPTREEIAAVITNPDCGLDLYRRGAYSMKSTHYWKENLRKADAVVALISAPSKAGEPQGWLPLSEWKGVYDDYGPHWGLSKSNDVHLIPANWGSNHVKDSGYKAFQRIPKPCVPDLTGLTKAEGENNGS